MVFFCKVGKGVHEGKYGVSAKSSFYVSESDEVLSVVSDHEANKYTGMKLDKFTDLLDTLLNKQSA
jgi:hypothetical protein